jgi:hypothetical protein
VSHTTIHGSMQASAASEQARPTTERRPRALWPLVGVTAFLSVGGFVGGISFIRDRTGDGLGAELSWLERTPVHDFLLPGMFLLGVYGIGSSALIVGLTSRRRWAWMGAMAMGATLVAWILYEFVILPDTMILQPILVGVGLAMLAIPPLPSMRRYYGVARPGAGPIAGARRIGACGVMFAGHPRRREP